MVTNDHPTGIGNFVKNCNYIPWNICVLLTSPLNTYENKNIDNKTNQKSNISCKGICLISLNVLHYFWQSLTWFHFRSDVNSKGNFTEEQVLPLNTKSATLTHQEWLRSVLNTKRKLHPVFYQNSTRARDWQTKEFASHCDIQTTQSSFNNIEVTSN